MWKDRIYNIPVFLSGSDKDILKECKMRGEHIKHAMYGALILIPAILGFVSMSYAVSTISKQPYIYLFAGALWGFTVMVIDRFIVSSYRKIPLNEDSDFWHHLFGTWGAVLSRIILAAVIGIAVGHPLVLWYFDDVIQDELRKEKIVNYQGFENSAQNKVKNINSEYQKTRMKWEEANVLFLQEMNGVSGGLASGRAGYGTLAKRAESHVNLYKSQLDSLQNIMKFENAKAKSEVDKNKKNLDAINVGYMSKDQALENLKKKKGWEITGKQYFIIFCFVLLDTIVVVLKAGLRPGPYDYMLTEKERSIIADKLKERIVWKKRNDVAINKDYDNRLLKEIENDFKIFEIEQNERVAFKKTVIRKEYALKTMHENNLFEINKAYAQERYNELIIEFSDPNIRSELLKKIKW